MSSRFPGGFDKPNIYPAVTGTGTTRWTGMWTLTDAANALVAGNWPSAPIWGMGYNSQGQLGLGNTTTYSSPKQVGNIMIPWTDIASQNGGAYALRQNGTLWAWGNNTNGAIGDGTVTNRSSPVQVGALTTWSKISGGEDSCHAIKTDGTLWAWGANFTGNLGLGNTTAYSSPIQVGALTTWSKIFAGGGRTYAIKTNGTLWAWGYNAQGALGLGNTTYYSSPKQVGALTTWAAIASCLGQNGHAKALKSDGTLWAWGSGANGQLGDGTTLSKSSPIQIGALTTWTALGLFGAIKAGELWHWGLNTSLQLGLGTTTAYSSPKQVGVQTNWYSLSNGASNFQFGTAIKSDGTLWGWGYNSTGQLGLNATSTVRFVTQIGNLTTWIKTTNTGSATIHLKTV
jgi:alpha-tubulin suppressor-like RCC1 family protein